MDSYTTNNGNSTTNSNSNRPQKSRSNTFSQAAVTKQDVGEFQSGYFVMVDNTPANQQQQRPKTHKTPERHSARKGEQQSNHQQQQRPRTSNKDIDQHQQREGDMHVSPGRLTTSPHRSPTRNKRSPSSHTIPQVHPEPSMVPTSPHKPRKAHMMDSGSPPKDKPSPSPATNRWAGPAFSNAPPPSSLPLPDFPPFITPSSANSSPSSSPPPSSPAMFAPPTMYHENIYIQPPLHVAQQQQPQFSYQFFYADAPSQPTYAEQLSTDLRKMLHIGQPISA